MGTPDEIKADADQPQRMTGDDGSVSEYSIKEKILAHKYDQSSKRARSTNPLAGMMFQSRPPGGTGQ